jgi:phenylacetate-CoA ligase
MPQRANRALRRLAEQRFPGAIADEAMSFQARLDASQWHSPAQRDEFQLFHLKRLATFAAHSIPGYAGTFSAERVAAAASLQAALDELPILSRQRLAADPPAFKAVSLPAGHTFSGTRKSSGTTGTLVEVDVTNVAYAWQCALGLRSYLWSGWDFSRTIAGVRVEKGGGADYPTGAVAEAWDEPAVFPFPTGSAAHLTTASTLDQQWEWLSRIQPAYLITYPSIVRAFAARAATERRGPCRLHGIATVGETVDTELREAARQHLGAEIFDRYSSQEAGLIACQCPTNRRYHIQDESVVVEVLRDDDTPAKPGEQGRVVVTPLHNFGSPLMRYDIGDIAEVGVPCSCGRGLRTLNRVLGRHRNIFRLADGRSFWPSFGARSLSRYMQVRQHQFRQLDFERIEVVVATSKPATPEQEQSLRAEMLKRLPAPFDISFRYVDEIPREAGGKYQEFVCLVA